MYVTQNSKSIKEYTKKSKAHGQEEPGGLQSMGLQRVQNY